MIRFTYNKKKSMVKNYLIYLFHFDTMGNTNTTSAKSAKSCGNPVDVELMSTETQKFRDVEKLLRSHCIVLDADTIDLMRSQMATNVASEAYMKVITLAMTKCDQGKITPDELGQVLKCHVAANE